MSVSPGRPKERSVPLGGTARSARGQPGNAALAVEGLGTVLDTDAGLVRASRHEANGRFLYYERDEAATARALAALTDVLA